jgi:predicted DNA binding CopG/RHH family protein
MTPKDEERILTKEDFLAMGEDEDTAEMLAANERDELVPVPDQEAARQWAMQAARNYRLQHTKDARVNIRLSSADVLKLKQRAALEGMPYQTLIASVLHKFVEGRLQ